MAETVIIILAEHNVPINFADHFTKLLSNKLVFPDSVFLRVRAARAPCPLKVVIARVVTIFFQKPNRSGHQNFGPNGLSAPAQGLCTCMKSLKNAHKIRGQSYFLIHAISDQSDKTFLLP